MSGGDTASKTEKPTPKRLKDGRKEGQVARTQDAGAWLAIAAAAALLPRTAQTLGDEVRALLATLPDVAADPTPGRALAVLSRVPGGVLSAGAPLIVAATAGALLGSVVQGVHASAGLVKPKFNRMSPKQGVIRMFGPRALWEAAKAAAKVLVIGVVLVVVARQLVPDLVGAGVRPLAATVGRLHEGVQTMLWASAITGLFIAGADYAYARRTVMKQLRMTLREVKDEHRQTEGDPMVKGAIRSRQMAMSRNRMLAAVTEADVVLVNPTHYAVALRYDRHRGAPRVVAKGVGTLALKIRERAREHRVPVVEDKPLTRLLYGICDLEDEIPAELYAAVARILAFVMSAGKPSRTATPRRPPTTAPPLPELSKVELRTRRARERRGDRRSARTG